MWDSIYTKKNFFVKHFPEKKKKFQTYSFVSTSYDILFASLQFFNDSELWTNQLFQNSNQIQSLSIKNSIDDKVLSFLYMYCIQFSSVYLIYRRINK